MDTSGIYKKIIGSFPNLLGHQEFNLLHSEIVVVAVIRVPLDDHPCGLINGQPGLAVQGFFHFAIVELPAKTLLVVRHLITIWIQKDLNKTRTVWLLPAIDVRWCPRRGRPRCDGGGGRCH